MKVSDLPKSFRGDVRALLRQAVDEWGWEIRRVSANGHVLLRHETGLTESVGPSSKPGNNAIQNARANLERPTKSQSP